MNFKELSLSNEILDTLDELGYQEATTIQEKTIPLVLARIDVIGLSQTGTGKTAAFGLPIIQNINNCNNNTQAIIVCPTRELVIQVAGELGKYSKRIKGIKIATIYGGQNIDRQLQTLKKGAHIVVGTPGRMIDHLRRRTLRLENVNTVILDEADEMLNMGFEQDVETILKDVPAKHQTVLFSATMNDRIMKVTKKHLTDPVTIKIKSNSLTVDKIEQIAIEIKAREKNEVLERILEVYSPESTIIFCNTKIKVDELAEMLKQKGYKVEALHGDIKQNMRDRIIQRFKKKDFAILVATDVAARGIDIKNISIVINYDIPKEEEYYVHRIGRTGRNGEKGLALSFIGPKDKSRLLNIERYAKTKLTFKELPNDKQVEEIRAKTLVNKIQNIINIKKSNDNKVFNMLKKNNDIEDIARALFTMLVSDIKSKTQKTNNNEEGNVKLFFNVGKKDRIVVGDIVGSVASNSNISGNDIGRINIMENFSFVEIPEEYVEKVLNNMEGKQIKGRNVNIEIAKR